MGISQEKGELLIYSIWNMEWNVDGCTASYLSYHNVKSHDDYWWWVFREEDIFLSRLSLVQCTYRNGDVQIKKHAPCLVDLPATMIYCLALIRFKTGPDAWEPNVIITRMWRMRPATCVNFGEDLPTEGHLHSGSLWHTPAAAGSGFHLNPRSQTPVKIVSHWLIIFRKPHGDGKGYS